MTVHKGVYTVLSILYNLNGINAKLIVGYTCKERPLVDTLILTNDVWKNIQYLIVYFIILLQGQFTHFHGFNKPETLVESNKVPIFRGTVKLHFWHTYS